MGRSNEGPVNGVPGEQKQAAREEGDDAYACHADMLSSFDLNTTQGQRNAARLRSSSAGPAGAFLTAILGGRMSLDNDMFVVSVWHRLGHHVHADLPPPPRRDNAVPEVLPYLVSRWSARRLSRHPDAP